jgi:hypothetical protein
LLVVGAGVLLAWLVLLLGAVGFVYTQLDARMDLREQEVTLRLPAGLEAQAQVQRPVQTWLDLRPHVAVPVRQRMRAQVDESLMARTTFEAVVQVDTVVRVDQLVPVTTELTLQVPLVAWLPAFDVRMPVTVRLPLRAELPVRAAVPVRFDAQVSGQLHAPVEVPLEAVFRVRPEVRGAVVAQIQGQTDFVLRDAMAPIPLTIEKARLLVPFDVPRIRQRDRP